MYKQCGFERRVRGGIEQDVAYMPVKFAKVGKKIRIDGRKGVWKITWASEVARNQPFIEGLYAAHRRFVKVLENA